MPLRNRALALLLHRSALKQVFEQFGSVDDVVTFPGRMYAFVNFKTAEDAARACEAMHVSPWAQGRGTQTPWQRRGCSPDRRLETEPQDHQSSPGPLGALMTPKRSSEECKALRCIKAGPYS
jgi:hypothetical protein